MSIYLVLFLAGVLTILLPCILPLVPVVLGVSIAGRRRWRPLVVVAGMAASFVLVTGVLQVGLAQFVRTADIVRIASVYALLLFGVCFVSERLWVQLVGALAGSVFFYRQGWVVMGLAALAGLLAVVLAGPVATRIQNLGVGAQDRARSGFGKDSLLTALVVGLTLGLVWVPCAGPALGFALTLARTEPGPRAIAALAAYAIGTSLPLLAIGYGGQRALASARVLSRHSGQVKRIAGGLLVLSAIALQYQWFTELQTRLGDNTWFGRLEERLVGKSLAASHDRARKVANTRPGVRRVQMANDTALPVLPRVGPAPEFAGLGPWYNSPPLTLASLRGKVVLVDFWTYSCVNCLRTLPELKAYWDHYRDMPFVIVGIHTPEFAFEKNDKNVADAIKRLGLTYPIAQDNNYQTWDAFGNRYWPTKYLIDADGTIRYFHFGEGEADKTDLAIRSLLAELGSRTSGPAVSAGPQTEGEARERSPETYLNSRGWAAFANSAGTPDDSRHGYSQSRLSLPLNHYALTGTWQLVGDERQVLRSNSGAIRYHALASEVNLVLGLEPGATSARADVELDGHWVKSFPINRHDMFTLWRGPYGEHEVTIKLRGAGVAAYAFTFGS